MKDQYFGDINDFRKYGLLRLLCVSDRLRLGVCWMLTDTDSRTDGSFLTIFISRRNTGIAILSYSIGCKTWSGWNKIVARRESKPPSSSVQCYSSLGF
jgi:hypothetical protein